MFDGRVMTSWAIYTFIVLAASVSMTHGDVNNGLRQSKFEVMKASNGSDLCATSGSSESFGSRSKIDCVNTCQSHVTVTSSPPCQAVNFRSKSRQCELFYQPPTSYVATLAADCVHFLVTYHDTVFRMCFR